MKKIVLFLVFVSVFVSNGFLACAEQIEEIAMSNIQKIILEKDPKEQRKLFDKIKKDFGEEIIPPLEEMSNSADR